MKAAILDIRHPALPKTALAKTVPPQDTARDLLRLFGVDRASASRCLVCHWHRDANGKLVAAWEPEIDPEINPAIARHRA